MSTALSAPSRLDSPRAPPRKPLPTPSLIIFGESFVGPFTLFRDRDRIIKKFKGASAKGLNNPKSTLKVADELLSSLFIHFSSDLLSEPRYALLIFGNVDLQINYLYNLETKPLTTASFPEDLRPTLPDSIPESLPGQYSAPGPQLHCRAVLDAYTTFIEREIVNGPVGSIIKSANAQGASGSKILICGALPPVVPDEIQPRIPDKYILRVNKKPEDYDPPPHILSSLARLSVSDHMYTPSPLPTGSDLMPKGIPVRDMLLHDYPLVTLPTRVKMVNDFNTGLKSFCDRYPDILGFVDISPQMLTHSNDPDFISRFGEVDQGTWRDTQDPSNIHPLWEPALPFWKEELLKHGIRTDLWETCGDPHSTLQAFEISKSEKIRRRLGSSTPTEFRSPSATRIIPVTTPSSPGVYLPPHRAAALRASSAPSPPRTPLRSHFSLAERKTPSSFPRSPRVPPEDEIMARSIQRGRLPYTESSVSDTRSNIADIIPGSVDNRSTLGYGDEGETPRGVWRVDRSMKKDHGWRTPERAVRRTAETDQRPEKGALPTMPPELWSSERVRAVRIS
ncbi:hypothetical protein M231_00347 [Tremella mesenterica]|uniref:Uncharacterized protein n=1 Tax=Tremella mesenterica TaxID=5217 RepID=A0A4V1M522_TREME|nr:hypothetical protein M231_00347 [Tremella mesenterica]